MEWKKVQLLYTNAWFARWHKLHHGLAQEIVIATCAAALFALFAYMFNDFLNIQINSVSVNMRATLATYAAYGSLVLAAMYSVVLIRRESKDPVSIGGFSEFLGEAPANVILYRILNALTVVIGLSIITWYGILKFAIQWPVEKILLLEAMRIFAIGFFVVESRIFRLKIGKSLGGSYLLKARISASRSALSALVWWRLIQILTRNRFSQILLATAAGLATLTVLLLKTNAPLVATVFASFLLGLTPAVCLCLQLRDDLLNAWFERTLGVSHAEFIKAYLLLSIALSAPFAFFVITSGLCLSAVPAISYVQIGTIIMIPCMVAPFAMFQIDGKRPVINILIIFIISLFLITGVAAHWAGLFILPVVQYYLYTAQLGRYYRA